MWHDSAFRTDSHLGDRPSQGDRTNREESGSQDGSGDYLPVRRRQADPERPKEKYLQALAYGFDLLVTDVRLAAAAAPGELGPWTPPIESGRLPKPVRDALDELIISLAKAGSAHGNSTEKIIEGSGEPIEPLPDQSDT